MCGFSFYFKTRGELTKQELNEFKSLSHLELRRRGPDNFQSVIKCNEKLLMCHARLSIQDLSASANQPMVSSSGALSIIFNGEIYNHVKLRNKFFVEDFNWSTTSDTETLLELIELVGIEQALSECIGMFSVCLYDSRNNTLSIARDKFGEKPLYYLSNAEYFAGGSTLTLLKRLSKLRLDNDSLSQYFMSGFISSPKTIFTDIHKVEPGQIITYCTNQSKIVSTANFFDLPAKFLIAKRSLKVDLVQVHEILREQITDAATSDVAVGVFQSGGVDSSIVSEISRTCSLPLEYSFTIGFSSSDLDETPIAKMISERANRKQLVSNFTDTNILQHLADATIAFDEPFADPSVIPMMALSRSAANKVKVVFGGDGGDELFFGYNRHRAFRKYGFYSIVLKYQFIMSLVATLLDKITKNRVFLHLIKGRTELKHKLKKLAKILNYSADEKKYWSLLSSDMPSLQELFLNDKFTGYVPSLPKNLKKLSSIEKIQYLDFRHFLADYVLQKVDRSSMYHSLEVRAPLLSDNLLKYCLDLEEEQLIDNLQSKKPLLAILQKLKTFSDVNKKFSKKRGFTPPLEDWVRKILAVNKKKYLDEKLLREQGIFDPSMLRLAFEAFEKYGSYRDFIWRFIVFQNWHIHHAKPK